MWGRLKAAWHDPVWSKVIAGAILGTPAVIWATRAVILSGVSGAVGQAGAGAAGAARWLLEPGSVPRWLLLLIVASIALLAWAARQHHRAIGHCTRTLTRHLLHRHAPPAQPGSEASIFGSDSLDLSGTPTPTAELPISPQPEPIGDLATDLRRFQLDRERLATHLGERERYLRSLAGVRVRWVGSVISIKDSGADRVMVAISEGGVRNNALVFYPSSFREQVFGLRKDDRVEITGTIDSADGLAPAVRGESLRLLV
jgi:hypothetical protein